MADFSKLNFQYLKEALKEPVNFWGMAGFAVAAAYTGSIIPLGAALAAEGLYLVTVPASSLYRRLVDKRRKDQLRKLRERQREELIKGFDPREPQPRLVPPANSEPSLPNRTGTTPEAKPLRNGKHAP